MLFAARFRHVPDERLKAHLGAFRRWLRWHGVHAPAEVLYWKPAALWVAKYLAHVAQGGPTASCHAYASLKWWATVVGLPLPMTDGLVAAWANPDAQHTVTPGTPLHLAIVWAMLRTVKQANGTVASFLTWTLILLVACLRFEHSRRSHSFRLQDGFLRATCSQGKRRVQGRSPPFDWAIPAQLTSTLNLSTVALLEWAELQQALGKPPSFLVPDLEVWTTRPLSPTTPKLPRPMALAKFNSVLRSVVLSLAAGVSSYSLRRFMPTAGEAMQFAPRELQAVGNWVELPQTGASPTTRQPVIGMAQRYAHDKVASAAFTKQQIFTSLHQAMLKSGQPAQCSWHDIRLHAPPREAILQLLQHRYDAQAAQPAKPMPPPPDDSQSDSSVSDSSSSDSAEATVLTVDTLPWFMQSAKGQQHLLQQVRGNLLVPWCRDTVFSTIHWQRGAGVTEVRNLCQKCLLRAPRVWRDACKALGEASPCP